MIEEWRNEVESLPDGFMDGCPKPLYRRILVQPIAPKQTSAGGIVLAPQTQEAEGYLASVGRLIAVGDQAWTLDKYPPGALLPEVGDWVQWAKHAGQRIEYRGVKLLFLNEDNLLAIAPDPAGLKVYV
jgi:co-chaperonin GroES (HSP10)